MAEEIQGHLLHWKCTWQPSACVHTFYLETRMPCGEVADSLHVENIQYAVSAGQLACSRHLQSFTSEIKPLAECFSFKLKRVHCKMISSWHHAHFVFLSSAAWIQFRITNSAHLIFIEISTVSFAWSKSFFYFALFLKVISLRRIVKFNSAINDTEVYFSFCLWHFGVVMHFFSIAGLFHKFAMNWTLQWFYQWIFERQDHSSGAEPRVNINTF